MNYVYILFTIAFTVYGQLIIKWQVDNAGALPSELTEKIFFILRLLLNPWIFSALIAAFLAALSWMAAMTKFDLSHAYPFMGFTFVLIMGLSGFFFNEAITPLKIVGMTLICLGIALGSQG